MSDSPDLALWVVLVAAPALMSKEGYHMPPQSHRETLRGLVERADGDLDRASILAGEWWRDNQRTTTDAEEFLDSLEREFEVTSTASQGLREVVSDARDAAGRDEEVFEAILRERIDPRENPSIAKSVDEEPVRPFRQAIIRVLMEEAERYWEAREGGPAQ